MEKPVVKKRKCVKFAILGLIFSALFALFFHASTLLRHGVTYIMHEQGFPEATVGQLHLNAETVVIENFSLDSSGAVQIDYMVGHYNWHDLKSPATFRFDKLEIAKARAQIHYDADTNSLQLAGQNIPLSPDNTKKQGTSSLPVLPVREIVLRQLSLNLSSDMAHGAMQISGTWKSQNNFMLQADLADTNLMTTPLNGKRISGWLSLDQKPETPLTVTAGLNAGSIRLYDLPLQAAEMTLTGSGKKYQIIGRAMVPGNAGSLSLDAALEQKDNNWHLNGKSDIRLSNLEQLKNYPDLQQSEFDLDHLKGSASLSLNFSATRQQNGIFTDTAAGLSVNITSLALSKTLKNISAQGQFSVTGNNAQESIDLTGTLTRFENDQATVQDAKINASANFQTAPLLTAGIKTGLIRLKDNAAQYIKPVKADISLTLKTQEAAHFKFSLYDTSGQFVIKAKGKHNLTTQNGRADINLSPITFMPSVTEPKDISPILSHYDINDVTGTVGFSGTAHWGTKTQLTGDLLVKNISANYGTTVKAKDINTVLHIDNAFPLKIIDQELAVAQLDVGIPLTDGLMTFSVNDKTLNVKNAQLTLADGKISVTPFSLDMTQWDTETTLKVDNLSLSALFALTATEGLEAEGSVSGEIPISFNKQSIIVKGGILTSQSPGTIRYKPENMPDFLQDNSNPSIADLKAALRNYHYETLRLELSGETGKDQTITLKSSGKNPNFYDGYPVDLNLNLEGAIHNVFKYNLGAYNIPETIRKQIEAYEKRNVPSP